MKKYYSNNCIKVNSFEYISKYVITNNNNKLFILFEYDKTRNDYNKIKETFNYYSFIDYLENNKIKKYFSEKDFM